MQYTVQRIAYSIALLILLAFIVLVPGVGVLALFVIPLPMMLLRMSGTRKVGVSFLVASIVVVLLLPSLQLSLFIVSFLLIGFVMAEALLHHQSKLSTLNWVVITLLFSFTLNYVLIVQFLNVNWVNQIQQFFQSKEKQIIDLFAPFDSTGSFETVVQSTFLMYELSLPTLLISGVVLIAFISVSLTFSMGKKFVKGFTFPKFPPFYRLKLPMTLVVIYGILLLVSFLQPMEIASNGHILFVNAMNIFRALFVLQGISFLHYALRTMKAPNILLVLVTLLALFFHSITVLIGILDTGMNLRNWIDRKANK